MKPLEEMSLEELWQLFPIILKPHNSEWQNWASDEISRLSCVLTPSSPVITHIGSTAIKGIHAKPIIDLLVEAHDSDSFKQIKEKIIADGYLLMSETQIRCSFNKGYTPMGFAEKVFHVHLRHIGDNDEILFRDYLNQNPSIAKEYEVLKLSLWKRFEHDRDGYTAAKTEFIKTHTEKARKLFKHKKTAV